MNILFVHSNFPAQFKHLFAALCQKDNFTIKFLAQSKEWNSNELDSNKIIPYNISREVAGDLCHPNLRRFEKAILIAQASLREAIKLNEQGFKPDLIIGHSGYGATLYLKELWPKAKFIGYFEWFYKSSGSDVGFGSNQQTTPDQACRIHTYNAPILMDLSMCDRAITPTKWQAAQFPKKWQSSIDIIFDGIDAQLFKPLDEKQLKQGLKIPGIELPTDVPLVTYTTRGFEPYRGWPQVAEGLSLLMQRNPQVHILLVGSDEVAYGSKRADGISWRQWAFQNFFFDPNRIHFSPPLQYCDYLKVLQHSWVHVYWTIPFILSWGLMESLSTGCSIVASNTAPVQEIIKSGQEAILVDFFDPDGMASRIDELIQDTEHRIYLGNNARNKIVHSQYDLEYTLKNQLQLINEVLLKS